ncbi:MAG: ferritin family protein, partial [bacterium]
MSATYNADEIIEIAENIEKNGARFYQQAARVCTDTNVRELLQELAEMEDRHESYFSS